MTTIIWTPELAAKLAEMRANGTKTSEIAKHFGCSKGAITGRVSRMGLEKRASPIWHTPFSDADRQAVQELLNRGVGILSAAGQTGASERRIRRELAAGTLTRPVVAPRPAAAPKPARVVRQPAQAVPQHVTKPATKPDKYIFGKSLNVRRPPHAFPGSAEVQAFIAARGVTHCPAAAAAETTGRISAPDTAAVAAHQAVREAARASGWVRNGRAAR